MFKKVLSAIGDASNATWKFFKGKKRYIALSAALLSKIIPQHTAVGASANFINDNLETINIGLEVIAGLFGGAAVVETVMQKLPSGLSEKKK
jgi:hypothetical protein